MRAFYQQQLTGALHISRDGVITSFILLMEQSLMLEAQNQKPY